MFKVRSDRTDFGVCVLPHGWVPASGTASRDPLPPMERDLG